MQNRLWQMINYAIGRLDYYEGYRHRYLQIGLAGIALAVTLFALVGRTYLSAVFEDPQRLLDWHIATPYLAVLSVVASLAWAGFRQLYLYIAYSTPEYPYRRVTSPDWFYRYVKRPVEEKHLLRSRFGKSESDKTIRENLQRTFLEELSSYGSRLIGRSGQETVVNDIEQLMALHTLTQYKQLHTSEMRKKLWMDSRIVGAIILVATIAIIVALVLDV